MTIKDLQLKIDRARWYVLRELPFYSSFVMRLVDAFDVRPDVPRAATDGRRVYWSSKWLAELSHAEVCGVLVHEGLHCGLQHLWRLPPDERGNRAGDYEINLIVRQLKGCELPDGALLDEAWRDVPCEEIYSKLTDDPTGDGGFGDFLAPADGDDSDGDGQGKGKPGSAGQPSARAPGESLREEWQTAMIQAVQAHGRGAMPGAAGTLLDRIKSTPVDWRAETHDFLRSTIAWKHDWSRQNRRTATARVIYPRRLRDDVGVVIFGVDVSGSIGTELASRFVAYCEAACEELACPAVLMLFDTAVQAEHRFDAGVPLPELAYYGGGTDFRPLFERAREMQASGEQVAGVVVLTDLDGPFPNAAEVDVPVLWIWQRSGYSDGTVPFGRVVEVTA